MSPDVDNSISGSPQERMSPIVTHNCLLSCVDALVPGGCPSELKETVIQNTGDFHEVAGLVAMAMYKSGWLADIGLIPMDSDIGDMFDEGVLKYPLGTMNQERFFGVIFQTSDILVPRVSSEGKHKDGNKPTELHVVAGIPTCDTEDGGMHKIIADEPQGNEYILIDTLHSEGPRLVIKTQLLDKVALKSGDRPDKIRGLLISGIPLTTNQEYSPEHVVLLQQIQKAWSVFTRSG